MVYTTDLGPHGRRYIGDQASPKLNYTRPAPVNYRNEKATEGEAGEPTYHLHIHDADPGAPVDPDLLDRVDALENAVAVLAAQECGNGEGEEYREPGEEPPMEEGGGGFPGANTEDPNGDYQDGGPARRPYIPGDRPRNTTDEPSPPPSPSAINEKNANAISRGLWGGQGHTTTGGSQSVPPNSNRAEGAEYQPNQQGTISEASRFSRTDRTLNSGRVFGVDAASLQAGRMHARATAAVNKQINSINDANKRFYARKGGR